MKITGTAVRLGFFSTVLLVFTVIIIVVFGQLRFERTNGYFAVFTNASGLRAGQFVRASGVEVGKVSAVQIIEGGRRVRVAFQVERSLLAGTSRFAVGSPLISSTSAQAPAVISLRPRRLVGIALTGSNNVRCTDFDHLFTGCLRMTLNQAA